MHKIIKLVLIILYFLFFIRNVNYGVLSVLSICIHELSHIIFLSLEDLKNLTFSILGFKIITNKEYFSKYEKILLYVSGSLGNLVFGFLCFLLMHIYKIRFFYEFMIINLIIGFINLIPVFPLDGAIIFRELLFKKFNQLKANIISIIVSFFIIIIMFLINLYFMLKFSFINLSYMVVTIFIFISTYREYKLFINTFSIASVYNKKYKIFKRGHIYTNTIVLHQSVKLLDIIKLFKINKFLIIYFVDDNFQIVGFMNEFNVLECYKKYGNIEILNYYEK